ncbi:MAG TPA: hypothetical protein VEC11_11270 [Allosphingosinicella sp.]|nr:hypothetical protein [Allosphingosinicella sp.]
MKILAILALVMPIMPAAATAQVQTAAQEPPAPPRSAHERICRTTGELGSRLGRTRVCKTRAQWEEARRENRDTIDRAQRQWNPTADEIPGG